MQLAKPQAILITSLEKKNVCLWSTKAVIWHTVAKEDTDTEALTQGTTSVQIIPAGWGMCLIIAQY